MLRGLDNNATKSDTLKKKIIFIDIKHLINIFPEI